MTNTSAQTCVFGITKACHLHAGNASKMAMNSSFSRIFADGISPAMILQKIHMIELKAESKRQKVHGMFIEK